MIMTVEKKKRQRQLFSKRNENFVLEICCEVMLIDHLKKKQKKFKLCVEKQDATRKIN